MDRESKIERGLVRRGLGLIPPIPILIRKPQKMTKLQPISQHKREMLIRKPIPATLQIPPSQLKFQLKFLLKTRPVLTRKLLRKPHVLHW